MSKNLTGFSISPDVCWASACRSIAGESSTILCTDILKLKENFKKLTQFLVEVQANLNKFIETVQLLSHKTFFIEISVNYDPASLLPQFIGDFFVIFLTKTI
jgi:hypothetical protein